MWQIFSYYCICQVSCLYKFFTTMQVLVWHQNVCGISWKFYSCNIFNASHAFHSNRFFNSSESICTFTPYLCLNDQICVNSTKHSETLDIMPGTDNDISTLHENRVISPPQLYILLQQLFSHEPPITLNFSTCTNLFGLQVCLK